MYTYGCKTKVKPFPNKPWFSHVCSTSLLKTLKGKIACNKCFSPYRTFCHFQQIQNCLQTLSVWKSLKFVLWERVNL